MTSHHGRLLRPRGCRGALEGRGDGQLREAEGVRRERPAVWLSFGPAREQHPERLGT